MDILLSSLACMLANTATTVMRYLPFENIITKKQKKVLAISHSIMLLLFFAINLISCYHLDIKLLFLKNSFVVYDVALTLVNIIVIKKHIREHLFTCGLIEIIMLTIFTIEMYIINSFITIGTLLSYILICVLMVILFAISYPYVKYQLISTVTPFLNIESDVYWKNIWLIPYVMFYASFILIPNNVHVKDFDTVINNVLITIATVFICRSIADDYKRVEENLAMQAQYNKQKEYYTVLSEKVAEQRKFKHDFKHHLLAIEHFCETQNREGLMEYCNELLQVQDKEAEIPYTGNGAVDGVLYSYYATAKKNNISFNIKGIFESSGIADIDLCVLLGNAIDNAIAGCMKVEDNRFIDIQSKTIGNVLAITISNSYDGVVIEEKGKIFSRKKSGRIGVGIASIKSICDKYGGSVEIKHDETSFKLMILLNKNIK